MSDALNNPETSFYNEQLNKKTTKGVLLRRTLTVATGVTVTEESSCMKFDARTREANGNVCY